MSENFSAKLKEHGDDGDEINQIREGVNDFKVPGYRGPNPPVGEHNYEFHLYALNAFPNVPKKVSFDIYHDTFSLTILVAASETFCVG